MSTNATYLSTLLESVAEENSDQKPRVYDELNLTSNKVVAIEALVLMKIMRHCRESFPTPVNGLLVGLDTDKQLEVTDCFGLQNKADLWNQLAKEKLDSKEVYEKVLLEDMRYQLKMMDQLLLVNADCSNVGWYQTLQFENLKDPSVVEGLCEHQELVKDAIVIGYDPLLASLGSQAFRAFRVTHSALRCRLQAEKPDAPVFNSLPNKYLLVEVPLAVKNSLLTQAFLTDWFSQNEHLQKANQWSAFEENDQNLFMQKSLQFVTSCLDDMHTEQEKLMRYHREVVRAQQKQRELSERRKLDNEQRTLNNEELLPEISPNIRRADPPNQLMTGLMANHVNRTTKKLVSMISDNVSRTFLFHKRVAS